MHEPFAADFDYLRIEDSGYEFVPQSTGGQLRRIVGRETHSLCYEHGRLHQLRLDRQGRAQPPRRPFVIQDLVYRADSCHQTERGQWLLFPLDPDGTAIRQFVGLIPRELWQRTMPYPAAMQLRVLQLFLHGGERAIWLHDHGCHGLVAVLATADWLLRRPVPIATLHAWLQLPQPQILQQLGLPGSPRVARILNRLPVSSCDYPAFRNLRYLHDPRLAREFSHLPKVNHLLLSLLNHLVPPRRLLSTSCLRKLSELNYSEQEAVLSVLENDVARRELLQKRFGYSSLPPTYTNIADVLRSWQNKPYLEELRTLSRAKSIPAPPFPDQAAFVTWFRTPGELLCEGQEMRHCILTYLPRIAQGMAVAAHVQVDQEHATALLERQSDGRWLLSNLRGKCNEDPSDALQNKFKAWLKAQPPRRRNGRSKRAHVASRLGNRGST